MYATRQRHRLSGIRERRTGDDWYVDRLDDATKQVQLLLVAQRRTLTRRARDDQTIAPLFDEKLGNAGRDVEIDGAVRSEGGHHRSENCSKARGTHTTKLPVIPGFPFRDLTCGLREKRIDANREFGDVAHRAHRQRDALDVTLSIERVLTNDETLTGTAEEDLLV